MSDRTGKCECSFAIRMVGDGCRYCQPQEYIDRLHDTMEDMVHVESLVQSLWATFRQYPEGARMYWRLPEKIQLENFEDTYSDGWTPNGVMMTQLRTRLVFPDHYKG